MTENPFNYYVGLDVSQRTTAICVVDAFGKIMHEGSANSRPQDIYGWLNNRLLKNDGNSPGIRIRVGLEAGSISAWLHAGLCQSGLDVLCMETFQAHRFLATFRNKTDKNDARGLAQLLRMGGEDFLRVVRIKSKGAQETRTLMSNRDHLVKLRVSLENHVCGCLKPYGSIFARSNCKPATFRQRIFEAVRDLENNDVNLMPIVTPTLLLHEQIVSRIDTLTKRVEVLAHEIPTVKRFMDIPGVGPITALSFYCAVDQPERFTKSADVAAYFGLTPRQYQSGDTDYMVGISKRGDMAVRRALVIAATVLLTSTSSWCSLKAWGVRLAARIGISKARVAVARKLAIIMHRMWLNNDRWRPVPLSAQERKSLMARMDRGANRNGVHTILKDCVIDEYGEIIA